MLTVRITTFIILKLSITTFSILKLNTTTLSITTFSILTLSIMTFSITIFSLMGSFGHNTTTLDWARKATQKSTLAYSAQSEAAKIMECSVVNTAPA
jgi:hypothetical protein